MFIRTHNFYLSSLIVVSKEDKELLALLGQGQGGKIHISSKLEMAEVCSLPTDGLRFQEEETRVIYLNGS